MRSLQTAVEASPHFHAGQDHHLAMLAHDIRGALQAVVGGLAAIDPAVLPLQVQEQLRRVSTAAQMIGSLTAALGVPGGGDRPASDETVALAVFLVHLHERWSGEVAAHGRQFDVATEQGLPQTLEVQRLALERILGNLMANAIVHGTGAIRLGVERTPAGGISFRLTNDGPPLDLGAAQRAAGPGLTVVQPTAASPGLGLQIVRTLVEETGATLHLGNRAGRVEACVSFPADRVVEGDNLGGRAAAVGTGPAANLAGVRLLLAEDNPTNQMVAVQMLGMLGADVTLAADGVEAMAAFEAGSFDLVVVDIEMPRLSGLDVIRAIRARSDQRARTPIVALTAYAMQEHRDRIAEAGANDLISKPIASIEALARALASHVRVSAPEAGPTEAPVAGKAAAAEVVVDRAVYEALAEAIGGEMMSELLEKVIADLTSSRQELARASVGLERAPIRSASHILISVAGAIGATRLQHCARALNGQAHAAGDSEVAALLDRCISEIDAAVAYAAAQRGAA